MSYLMRNKLSDFAFVEYLTVSVLFIFILASMQCKICNRFFTILSDPDGRPISNFDRFSLCLGWIHKVLTLPATVLLAKNNSVMFPQHLLFTDTSQAYYRARQSRGSLGWITRKNSSKPCVSSHLPPTASLIFQEILKAKEINIEKKKLCNQVNTLTITTQQQSATI